MIAIFFQKLVVYNNTESFPSVVQGSFRLFGMKIYCSFLSQINFWTKMVRVVFLFQLPSTSSPFKSEHKTYTLQTQFKVNASLDF